MEETGNLGDPARDLLQTEDRNDKEEDKNDRDDSAKQEEGDDMEKDVSVEQRTQHFLDKEFASR
jgi:Ran GTPase-activating protein (RanGAP) involved in mRNA processing and transport